VLTVPEGCIVSFGVVDVSVIPADAALPKNRAATRSAIKRYSVCTSLLFRKIFFAFIIYSPAMLQLYYIKYPA
jgi:hypothetical protein